MPDRDDLIKICQDKLKTALAKRGNDIQSVSVGTFQAWGLMTVGKFKAKQLSGRPGLKRRSGMLSKNTRFTKKGSTLSDLEGHFTVGGPAGKYAHLQEYGGTVKPKKAKMLAIPIPGSPAMTDAGVSNYASPLRQTLPKSYDFFVLETGKQALLMGDKKGEDKPQPWYVLKHSVYVPPRMGFKKTIRSERRTLLAGMRKDIRRILRNG